MENINNIKNILIFIAVEIIIFWLVFWNYKLAFFWLFNVILLYIYFNKDSLWKSLNSENKLQLKWFSKFWEKIKNNALQIVDNSEVREFIRDINYHYVFFLSLIICILSIVDNFLLKVYYTNLLAISLIFIVSFFLSSDQIMKKWIYFWIQKITERIFIFVVSLIILMIVYPLFWSLELSLKVFVTILIWFIFSVVALLWVWAISRFKSIFSVNYIKLYSTVLFLSLISILRTYYPQFKELFIVEKIITKTEYVEKSSLEKENSKDELVDQNHELEKEISEKLLHTHIAPNWKEYEVIKTLTGYYFTWINWNKVFFDSYISVLSFIDENNKIIETDNYEDNNDSVLENEESISEQIDSNYTDNAVNDSENTENSSVSTHWITESDDIISMLSKLMNEDPIENEWLNEIWQLPNWENLSFGMILPFLINKFWIEFESSSFYEFEYVVRDNILYDYFNTAYKYWLIWRDTNPDNLVTCETFMVMVGLLDWWELEFNKYNIFDVFWNEALLKWYVPDSCYMGKYIRKEDIIF